MIQNLSTNNYRQQMFGSQDKIIIYQGELEYLSQCINESPDVETGGNLFGVWTPFGIPMVQYVVGPGPAALHQVTHFRQDIRFLEANADSLVEEHALHHIGTWHSHHSLGLTMPSEGDMHSTLTGMRECGLDSFVLVIGNYHKGKSSVNAFRYFSNGSCVRLRWVRLPGSSPYREVYDKIHRDIVYRPHGIANMMPLDESRLIDNGTSLRPTPPKFDSGYWLTDSCNRKEFAMIVKFLKTQFENVGIYQLGGSCVELRLTALSGMMYKFLFDATFPAGPPKLLVPKGTKVKHMPASEWSLEGKSLSNAFIHFFKSIEI